MSDIITTFVTLYLLVTVLSPTLLSHNWHLVIICCSLAVICVCFARQRNQNCRTLSVCYRFVASFYRHVTNIVTEFVTSVVLSCHFVAVMWLSYVRQSNYIVTLASLSQFANMFCCHVTDLVLELVTHCHCLVVIVSILSNNITKIITLCQFVTVLLHLFTVTRPTSCFNMT